MDVTNISVNFATLNGSYNSDVRYSPDECGFIYATHSNPVEGGTRITASLSNKFSRKITNLSKATYYVKAYAKNSYGIEYGEEQSFQVSGTPLVTTLAAISVTANSAVLNGKIEYQGDPAYTERGFVYSNLFPNPGVDDIASATTKKVVLGTDADFSAYIAGLTSGKTYYARAYATNSNGTVYGASVIFKTSSDYVTLQSEGMMVHKNDISSHANWDTAKTLCENSNVGDYRDWRLPTLNELIRLYNNRSVIGGFYTDNLYCFYWSSDGTDPDIGIPASSDYRSSASSDHYILYDCLNFHDGSHYMAYYYSEQRVRCVRNLP